MADAHGQSNSNGLENNLKEMDTNKDLFPDLEYWLKDVQNEDYTSVNNDSYNDTAEADSYDISSNMSACGDPMISGVESKPRNEEVASTSYPVLAEKTLPQTVSAQEYDLTTVPAKRKASETLVTAFGPFPPKKHKAESMDMKLGFQAEVLISSNSTIYRYCPLRNKVYVKPYTTFRIKHTYKEEAAAGKRLFVRATVEFRHDADKRRIVRRCINHQCTEAPSRGIIEVVMEEGEPEFISYWPPDDAAADCKQPRSVLVPISASGTVVSYRIICMNSCLKALRPSPTDHNKTAIIFSIEDDQNVYGRYMLEYKCSGNPRRCHNEDLGMKASTSGAVSRATPSTSALPTPPDSDNDLDCIAMKFLVPDPLAADHLAAVVEQIMQEGARLASNETLKQKYIKCMQLAKNQRLTTKDPAEN